MKLTESEYFSTMENNNWEPLVVSPRPGVYFGTCRKCLEWRPLPSEPISIIELARDMEIEKDIPIELNMWRGEAGLYCPPCNDAEEERWNQEDQFDEDPMSLPKEVRERIRQERKELREWERDLQARIQQCAGTTKTGLRCSRTIRGPVPPNLNEWRCSQHRIECPHCQFIYPKMPVSYFGNTSLGQHPLHRCEDEDGVPTGLGCITCGCTFDPQLDLLTHGRHCAIWGSGPRPGTTLAVMLEDPEFLSKAVAYTIEEERKYKRLQEWRKQQELEQGDSPQE